MEHGERHKDNDGRHNKQECHVQKYHYKIASILFQIVINIISLTLALDCFLGLLLKFLSTNLIYLKSNSKQSGANTVINGKMITVTHVIAWKYKSHTM